MIPVETWNVIMYALGGLLTVAYFTALFATIHKETTEALKGTEHWRDGDAAEAGDDR